MKNFLDIRTISFFSSILMISFSAIMFYIIKKHQTYPGFRLFKLAALFNGTGILLISLRGYITVFLSVIVSNSLLVLALSMILWSMRLFCGNSRKKKEEIFLTTLFTLLFFYFTYFRENITIRIIIQSLFLFYISLKLTLLSLHDINKKLEIVYIPFFASSLLLSLFHLYRVLFYLLGIRTETSFMSSAQINSIVIILHFTMLFIMHVSIIALNSYRSDIELKKSRKEIKTLQELLPICSHCHKIRADNGFWEKLELYMQKNSDILFTHGICPECEEKYYSDYKDSRQKISDSGNKKNRHEEK